MSLKEISERSKDLKVFELRKKEDNHFEIVFLNADADKWRDLLTGIMGPAAKPAGKKPEKTHTDLTKQYGGIFLEQTLYVKEEGLEVTIAMFWPWQDGAHTTLKVFLFSK